MRKRGHPKAAARSPPNAPSLSPVNFCARCTVRSLPRLVPLEGENGGSRDPLSPRGRRGEGRKERGADHPRALPHSHPGVQGPRVPRPGNPPQGATGPAREQGTRPRRRRGGGETRAAEPGTEGHSPQHAEPSSSATTRGHISAPAAGSPPPPPPQVSGATAAAVTDRTGRRLSSRAGPAAQAGGRAHARSRSPTPAPPTARAAHAHSPPPPPRPRSC